MRILIIAFVISFASCNSSNNTVEDVKSRFISYQSEFDYIRNFFSDNSYDMRGLDFKDGVWQTRRKDYKVYLAENNMIASGDIDTLLSIFSRLDIAEVSGDASYTEIHFNHGLTDCYIIRFELDNSKEDRKVDSVYRNAENDFWYIRLDKNWMAKRVSCM